MCIQDGPSSPSERLVFIHIGTHKTGSSAIQRALSSRRTQLARIGLLYPLGGRVDEAPDGHHALARSVRSSKKARKGLARWEGWAAVLGELSLHEGRGVLSSEGFESLTGPDVGEVRRLLSGFDTRVIVYLRNPLDFMVSAMKQQVAMGRPWRSFRRFIEQNVQRCDYPRLLATWESEFGSDRVLAKSYDQLRDGGRLLDDFLGTVGVQTSDVEELFASGADLVVNRSPSPVAIEWVGRLNRLQERVGRALPSGPVHRLRRRILRSGASTLRGGRLETDADIAWLREQTSDWMVELFDRYLDPSMRPYFEF